jgi:integral membrane protein (TIGR01906 family)
MSAARRSGGTLGAAVVAVATAAVLVGLTTAVFFNPAWVSFAQGRTDAAALTGWSPEVLDALTREMVAEVWLGPGTFAQEVAGEPVLNARERSHMLDVRRLVLAFYAFVGLALITLIAMGVATGWRWTFWRAVARGAGGLAVGAVAVGGAFFLVFDWAFTVFHQIFFAPDTWTFDPLTERLVQIFPRQLWTETTVALAIVGLSLAVAVWLVAGRLGRPPREPAEPMT